MPSSIAPAPAFRVSARSVIADDRFAFNRRPARLYFLDNLKTFVIFLVVLLHAGIVYESSGIGAWFWIVDDPMTNDLSGLVNVFLDIWLMPTLFFVSGYFAPSSLESRGGMAFFRAKLRRLMLPWFFAAVTLLPIYKMIFLYSRGLHQEHWTSYFPLANGIFSLNWLWFLPILFLFNALYLIAARLRINTPKLSVPAAGAAAFLVGFVYCVGIDMFGLRGWTKLGVIDFQNERLLIYLLAFVLGILCYRRGVFAARPQGRALYWTVGLLAWIPVCSYIVFLLYPWIHPDSVLLGKLPDTLVLWFSYQLALSCLVYLAIETFRRYLNAEGRIMGALNSNSYYVYIIHVVVLGVIALMLLDRQTPSLLKYLILAVATFVVSNMIVSGAKLWPIPLRAAGQLRARG